LEGNAEQVCMHGQTLPSVYVNGPNVYEIAFFMITS